MKKVLSLALALLLILFSTSCAKDKVKEENGGSNDTEKNVQNYDELEYKSNDRYSDGDLLSVNTADGAVTLAPDCMLVYTEGGIATTVPFIDPVQTNYSGAEMPFGAKIGDSAESFAKSFSLDTGYAAYVEKGSEIAMYESGKLPDFKNGGYVYFGYALDGTGKWAFMDYYMLVFLMQGQLDVRGFEDTYNVILYCCTVDDSANISLVTELYGDLAKVMSITSGQK